MPTLGASGSSVGAEERVARLQLDLPKSVPPVGNFVRAVQSGNLLFVSGHLPDSAGVPCHTGKLGRDLTTAEGYQAARQATINLLGTVRGALGDLDHVIRVVKLFGMVNSTEDFTEQPQVMNGASDLLHEVFGSAAVHARSAVGMAQLPRNNCVEIEAIIEVEAWRERHPCQPLWRRVVTTVAPFQAASLHRSRGFLEVLPRLLFPNTCVGFKRSPAGLGMLSWLWCGVHLIDINLWAQRIQRSLHLTGPDQLGESLHVALVPHYDWNSHVELG